VWGGQRGLAEQVDQVVALRAEGGLGREKSSQPVPDWPVSRVFLQRRVVEQLPVGQKRWVEVGQPDSEHFFQHDGTVAPPGGAGPQVARQVDLPAVDPDGWELGAEFSQDGV